MKSKIVFLGILLFCISNCFAQKRPKNDWQNESITASGTFFDTEIRDKKWANINGKSFTSAKFNYYQGLTYAKLMSKKDMQIALDYDIEVTIGNVEIQVVDSNDEVVFQKSFGKSKKGVVNLALKENENYQIRFIGTKAKGSYFCQWKEVE